MQYGLYTVIITKCGESGAGGGGDFVLETEKSCLLKDRREVKLKTLPKYFQARCVSPELR